MASGFRKIHLDASMGCAGEPVALTRMTVVDNKIPTAELKELVEQAHTVVCPYSHATRDNVDVQFDVQGA